MANRFSFRVWINENKEFQYFGFNEDGSYSSPCSLWRNETPIQQSTGLVDMNGKLIFEGDVVKLGNGSINGSVRKQIFEVKWEINKFNIPNWIVEKPSFSHYIEKIGNIYENSYLIKE